ncbi:unnamed protein product [Schistosoma curassoni]|uniref:Sec2p domain-containing protein n=1 Tax=Schistosoma curassoni TaxID=6186 RepID=A0A183JY72_9TREM|nr:unnamed protein product [Schistosoma curassoni]
MERLQQLLKQQSLTQTPFQQQQQQQKQMQNQLFNSQSYMNSTNSHEKHVNNEDDDDDESLQEFSKPNNNQSHQQQKQTQLPQQTSPPIYQQNFSQQEQQLEQSTKSEFSFRHQSQAQQSSQASSLQPSMEQPSTLMSLESTQQQQQQQPTDQPFNRKFRQSWRKTPDNLPTKELKKATKLLDNDISLQDDDYEEEQGWIVTNSGIQDARLVLFGTRQLDVPASQSSCSLRDSNPVPLAPNAIASSTQLLKDDIFKLHEELENARVQNNEMKTALIEARTIIDQQQNQLTEFRRYAAQYQTDAEAFKMKSMFLLNNTQTHDEQVNILINACERLEAEVDALTWQLDRTKQSLDLKTQECNFLNEQLDEIQLNGSYHSPNLTVDNHNHNHNHHTSSISRLDKLKTGTDQCNSILSTEYKSFTGSQTYRDDNDNNQHDEIPAEIIAKLNNLHEEKTTWRLYATSLVRSFVENCEEFIRKTPYNEPYFESETERRWYTYSMHLLENLLNVAPYQLSKTDLNLLKRTKNPITNHSMFQQTTESNNPPELLTALDFPSQVQLNNSYVGGGGGRNIQFDGLVQQQQSQNTFTQGYDSYNRESKQSYQQRAARAASKPLTNFYRKKK